MTLASIVAYITGFRVSANNGNGGYSPPSQPPNRNTGGSSETSTLAIVTLALGILSWTLLPGITAWGGVITGWIELDKIKKGESPASNKTITQIGFWASVVNVALQFIGGCIAGAILIFGWAAFAGIIGLSAAAQ
ncbi:MAG: hypothetical protein ACQEVA_12345 [Myxococcota bacterium]